MISQRVGQPFYEFFRHHPQPMIAFDLLTLEIYDANHAATARYANGAGSLVGSDLATLFPPEERVQARDVLRGLDSREAPGVHLHTVDAQGNAFLTDLILTDIAFDARSARVAHLLDARERYAAGEALLRTRAELAETQELAHVGSFEIDLRSGDVRWSTELYRIAGVDQASGEPRPLWEFGRKDEFAGAVEVLVQARIDGRAYSLEHRIETIDGDERILVERGRYLFEPGASEPHRLIGAVVDISEQRSAEERLRYLAQHDELTGLPNRALLADSLRAALVRRVPERWVAVVAIDLDRFTAINDGHTHALGDRVLRETAERLRRALDRHGTLARPAADEFVAIVEDIASEADARAAAERLRTAVGEPHALEGLEIVVTASLGIALAPRDGAAPAELFGAADAAMHAVKALGGDGIAVFSGDLRARRRGSHVRERALRDALEHGALEVAYQPIVAARSGRISGFEALVRWEDEGRAIEPNEFVALAESTGLIGRLGSFVLEGVVQRLAQLAARGRDELSIAVNISAHQLQTRNFVAELGALLAQHAIEPARLHIEITESAYITGEAGVHNVRALADLGVAISIDDFGTGYSSLGYLKLLPVDALKIDRSFITEILEDPADRAIVGAIVAVARHLGLAVIAEGVESAAQARYLQRAGCTHLQGYHFARPLVGHEFEVLVASDFVLPGSQAV